MSTLGGIGTQQIILCDDNGVPIGKEYTFQLEDGLHMNPGMPDEKDAPDVKMDDGTLATFIRGKRFYAELTFEALSEALQYFLKDLGNHDSKIKFIPHVDKPQFYWVKKDSDFDPDYFMGKYALGFHIALKFTQIGFSPAIDWT